MQGLFCLAGLAEPPHAVPGRAHQSPGHRDDRRAGRGNQRVRGRHDASQPRLQANPAGMPSPDTPAVCGLSRGGVLIKNGLVFFPPRWLKKSGCVRIKPSLSGRATSWVTSST